MGGDCIGHCRSCQRRCSSAVNEEEGAPMVDVDLICVEVQVDSKTQVGESWPKSWEWAVKPRDPNRSESA